MLTFRNLDASMLNISKTSREDGKWEENALQSEHEEANTKLQIKPLSNDGGSCTSRGQRGYYKFSLQVYTVSLHSYKVSQQSSWQRIRTKGLQILFLLFDQRVNSELIKLGKKHDGLSAQLFKKEKYTVLGGTYLSSSWPIWDRRRIESSRSMR